MQKNTKNTIRSIYLYTVSIVAIVIMLISSIGLINLILKEYVFDVKGWEELDVKWQCSDDVLLYKPNPTTGIMEQNTSLSDEEKEQKKVECEEKALENAVIQHTNNVKSDFVLWLSMLIVAVPVYILHWRLVRKEK